MSIITKQTMLLGLLLCLLWPMAQATDGADWELVARNEGIKIYMAQLADDHLHTFRGVTTMKLADFSAIGAFMDDYDFVADWLHMVSSIDGIRRFSADDRLVYLTTRLPWPVSDRDVVLRVSMQQNPETYAVKFPLHNVGQLLPPKEGFVRMPQMKGFLLFRPLAPGKVEMTLQVIVDPGGHIPDWIANLLMRDIPYYSLMHLRERANDPRFRNQHLDYYKLPPAWLKTRQQRLQKASLN